jgi:hypothetical protein
LSPVHARDLFSFCSCFKAQPPNAGADNASCSRPSYS